MNPEDTVLGIDLGTTNSVVAVANGVEVRVITTPLGHRLIPSVVSFKPDGTILVGDEARERRLIDAKNTVYSVKRLIGRPYSSEEVARAKERFAFELVNSPNGGVVVDIRGETYTLTEISAFVLREVRRVAEERLGHPVARAVITVPANFNELQRSATKAAARVAGLEVLRIINEPTAAALAYGLGAERAERVAVYDLGGGTFDLTLLELEGDVFEVIGTAGDSFLGGDDLDLAMTEMMCEACLAQHRFDPRGDQQAYERLRAAAEWAKCQLSDNDAVEAIIEELAYGRGGRALDLEFRVDRRTYEDRIRPLLATSFDVCNRAMDEAGLKARDVDGVVLVGGSTRVPLVREMVGQYFGQPPRTDIDPDLVVGQGAAIHGFALRGRKVRQEKKSSLGKVALRKVSMEELQRLKKDREKRKEQLPKQPAFAPTAQVELPPGALVQPPRKRAAPPSAAGPQSLTGMPGVVDHRAAAPGGIVEARAPRRRDPRAEPSEPSMEPAALPPAKAKGPPPPLPPAAPPPLPGPNIATLPPEDVEAMPSELPSLPADAFEAEPLTGAWSQDDDMPELDIDYGDDAGDGADLPPVLAGLLTEPPMATPPTPPPAAVMMRTTEMPLLMDVTPHALGIETAGGYCQHLIRRNVPVPVEQSRIFTTAADDQESVAVRICQGEGMLFDDNQPLGEIELRDLRAAVRGAVKIDVTFIMDASGTLEVKAVDVGTGRAQQIRVQLLGGADDAAIEAMRARQQRLVGE
ncbi:MAG: Hsp70 family protein [Myxococcota bacterium]